MVNLTKRISEKELKDYLLQRVQFLVTTDHKPERYEIIIDFNVEDMLYMIKKLDKK
jgi:hypothetical protein